MAFAERCPHASCRCAPRAAHSPWCSPYCANAAQGESLPGEAELAGACACGHAGCVEEPAAVEPGPVISTGRR